MTPLTSAKFALSHATKPFDVVCCGENSVDLVAVVDRFPEPDGKTSSLTFDVLRGGQATTAAIGCARQGWRSRYIGAVGADDWANVIRAGLDGEGVDVNLIRRTD